MTGADDVDYAWYVLDDDDDDYTEATAVGTKSTYKVGQADLGKYILVVVEDEDGDIAVSDVTSAVAEKDVELPDDQIEGVISIEDVSGLQSDGTGLVGDTLRAVVPATMGSFSNVIFYRDGKQLNSTTQNGAQMWHLTTRPGKYTVSVIGSDNKVYLSDSIDVVDTEAPAIINAVSIEDDYATPKIDIDTEDHEAVISVTLNKNYKGQIEVFKASDLKFNNGAVSIVNTNAGTGTTAGLIDDRDAMPTTAQVAAATDGNILRYVDPETGATTFKWTVAAAGGDQIIRGTEYKVVFDQNSITTDTPGQGSENEGPNTITAPYLETPVSMSIDSVGNGQPVVISFVDANGGTLTWMGNPIALTADNYLSQLKVFADKNNDMKDGTERTVTLAGSSVKNGVMTTDATGTADAFYYATAKTISGLFGKKAVDIASTLGTAAQEAASSIGIAQDGDDPYTAKISFENLRADGTVYVLQSYDPTTDGNTNDKLVDDFAKGTISAKASETVTSGTKEVKIAGAIDALATNKNHYMAVFIPDDLANYSQIATTTGATVHGVKVASKLKSYKIEGVGKWTNTTTASYDATGVFSSTTDTAILGYDQFGTAMTDTAITEATGGILMTCSNPTVAFDPTAKVTLTLTKSTYNTGSEQGYASITAASDKTKLNKGESWTLKLATGQTLTVTSDSDDGTVVASAVWKVSLS